MFRRVMVLVSLLLVLCTENSYAMKLVEQAGLPKGVTALTVPESTADYLTIRKSAIKNKVSANKELGGSGGGGGGGSEVLPPPPTVDGQGFAPEITPMGMFYYFSGEEMYVSPVSNEPVVYVANLRAGEQRKLTNAWMVVNRAYPDDGTIGLTYVRTIRNSSIRHDWYTLDLHSFNKVSLLYVVLTENGEVRASTSVRGVVKDGVFRFYYNARVLQKLYLYPGDTLLIGLEAQISTPGTGLKQKTYAPSINLSDGTSTASWEWTPDLGWKQGAPLLPSGMDTLSRSGEPGVSQFTLINPDGTTLWPSMNQREILPGETDAPLVSAIIRGTGQGGLWQIAEATRPQWDMYGRGKGKSLAPSEDCASAGLTNLSISIDGVTVIGTRVDRGTGYALWLFDMSALTFHEMEEKSFTIVASLSPDACTDTMTSLSLGSLDVGYWSEWSGMVNAPRTMYGDWYFTGLYPANGIGYIGFSFPHSEISDPDPTPDPVPVPVPIKAPKPRQKGKG